jgi:hypothetical protein
LLICNLRNLFADRPSLTLNVGWIEKEDANMWHVRVCVHKGSRNKHRWQTEKGLYYRWVVKSGLNGIYLPVHHTVWLLVEVALLLIGLTQISLTKFGFIYIYIFIDSRKA